MDRLSLNNESRDWQSGTSVRRKNAWIGGIAARVGCGWGGGVGVAHVEGAADYRRTSTGEGRGGGDWLKGLSLRRRAVRFRGARVGSELGRAKR